MNEPSTVRRHLLGLISFVKARDFVLNFLCKFQTHYCFKFFLESFVELFQASALLTQHYWTLLWSKVCFASPICYTVYAVSYYFGHSNPSAYKPCSSGRVRPFSNTVQVFFQSVHCFSETVCRLPATPEEYAHLWLTCYRTQTQVALFSRGFCVIDGYCQHSLM